MNYTKSKTPLNGADAALTALRERMPTLTDAMVDQMIGSGVTVTLKDGAEKDGAEVWIACVGQEDSQTAQIDFLTIAIAGKDGAAWIKANGQPVATYGWHGVRSEKLAEMGMDACRKALMMIFLGQPPLKDDDGNAVFEDALATNSGARSIQVAIAAAHQLKQPMEDVL